MWLESEFIRHLEVRNTHFSLVPQQIQSCSRLWPGLAPLTTLTVAPIGPTCWGLLPHVGGGRFSLICLGSTSVPLEGAQRLHTEAESLPSFRPRNSGRAVLIWVRRCGLTLASCEPSPSRQERVLPLVLALKSVRSRFLSAGTDWHLKNNLIKYQRRFPKEEKLLQAEGDTSPKQRCLAFNPNLSLP